MVQARALASQGAIRAEGKGATSCPTVYGTARGRLTLGYHAWLKGAAVFVGVEPFSANAQDRLNIVVGVAPLVARSAVPYFQNYAVPFSAIFKVMSRSARGETCRHAWEQLSFSGVCEQGRFSLEHVDKFVLTRVAMV
jgi:hypothetical protein